MPTQTPLLSKVGARRAREVAGRDHLDEEALALLGDDQTPLEFLDVLIAHERFADAIQFLAHAIPRREAVWWGCLCVKLAGGDQLPPAEVAALTAAVRWALRPEEERRAAAKAPAEAVGFEAPAGVLAHAVSFSGGSLSPPGLPEVPPKPTLTPRCVAAAIKLAAATAPPDQAEQIFQRFLAIGIGIASGKHAEKLPPAD
jgi:hypothetical protein